MSKIVFKKAGDDNVDKFYQFFSKSIKKDFIKDFTPKTLNYFLDKVETKSSIRKALKEGFVILALDAEEVVGYTLVKHPPIGGVWFLNWLAIDPNYRGQGIASKLLKKLEDVGIKKGIHGLLLLAVQRNVKFYKNRGFMEIGTMPKGYYGQEDIYFYKIIQEPKEENYLK